MKKILFSLVMVLMFHNAHSDSYCKSDLHFQRIAFDGTQYMVLAGKSLLRSQTGELWTKAPINTPNTIRNLVILGGEYFLLGENGTLLSSTDGKSWIALETKTTQTLFDIVKTNDKYVAVGSNVVLISQNRTDWKAIEPPKDSSGWFTTLFDIVWTGTQFVALGDTRTIITSFDGEIWNTQSSPLLSVGEQMHAISWNGTTFVIALSGHMVMTSPDAVTWTKRTVDGPDFTLTTNHKGHLLDVAWSGTRFMAVGYYAVGNPPELRVIRVTSANGVVNWYWEPFGSLNDQFTSVYANGENYVAVGDYGNIVSNFLSLNNGACNIVAAAADPATPSTDTTTSNGGQTDAKGGGGMVDNFFLVFMFAFLARSFKGRRPR